jgi:hypothetical protein
MRKIFSAAFFITCLFLISTGAYAAQAENPGVKFTTLWDLTLKDTHFLEKVKDTFGSTDVAKKENDFTSLCYKAKGGYVQFLGGTVGSGFLISQEPPRKNCASLPSQYFSRNVDIGGIKLGMTQKAFTKIVGASIKQEKNKLSAQFNYKIPMTAEDKEKVMSVFHKNPGKHDYYDGQISIKGIFLNNALMSAEIWNSQTY